MPNIAQSLLEVSDVFLNPVDPIWSYVQGRIDIVLYSQEMERKGNRKHVSRSFPGKKVRA